MEISFAVISDTTSSWKRSCT